MKNSLIVIFIILFNTVSYSQDFDSSELVFFKDKKLTKLLEDIVVVENTCAKKAKTINWYIDFKEDNVLLVSQSRTANLLEIVKGEKQKILSTTVNDKIVFILTNNEKDIYLKSGFFIDLRKYKDNEVVFFEDFSVWQIKKENDLYRVANKRIWKCK